MADDSTRDVLATVGRHPTAPNVVGRPRGRVTCSPAYVVTPRSAGSRSRGRSAPRQRGRVIPSIVSRIVETEGRPDLVGDNSDRWRSSVAFSRCSSMQSRRAPATGPLIPFHRSSFSSGRIRLTRLTRDGLETYETAAEFRSKTRRRCPERVKECRRTWQTIYF